MLLLLKIFPVGYILGTLVHCCPYFDDYPVQHSRRASRNVILLGSWRGGRGGLVRDEACVRTRAPAVTEFNSAEMVTLGDGVGSNIRMRRMFFGNFFSVAESNMKS